MVSQSEFVKKISQKVIRKNDWKLEPISEQYSSYQTGQPNAMP